jgi:hypothetical protein
MTDITRRKALAALGASIASRWHAFDPALGSGTGAADADAEYLHG